MIEVGQVVEFTNEAGQQYRAIVQYVHTVNTGTRQPMLDLVHVDANVHLPNGPCVSIGRIQIEHQDTVSRKGQPYWTEAK